ncbi:hypothetical protein P691DRAFT_678074, partial [Macrolepiota fuliginosa MF-IS2]
KCYALPYGVFGCVSHFIAYYALIWLWCGRSPLPPWRKLSCKIYDIIIVLIGSMISVGMAAFTIVKCRHTWPLLALAIWETCLSLLVGITGIHAARAIKKTPRSLGGAGSSMWWTMIYFPGMIVGMVGLMFLVLQALLLHEKDVTILTIAFFVAVLAGAGIIAFPCTRNRFLWKGSKLSNGEGSNQVPYPIWLACGFGGYMIFFAFLVAFYSDMALGMMARNLFGLPHGEPQVLLYWIYLGAGPLILFCF